MCKNVNQYIIDHKSDCSHGFTLANRAVFGWLGQARKLFFRNTKIMIWRSSMYLISANKQSDRTRVKFTSNNIYYGLKINVFLLLYAAPDLLFNCGRR